MLTKSVLISGITGNVGSACAGFFYGSPDMWDVYGISRFARYKDSETARTQADLTMTRKSLRCDLTDWSDVNYSIDKLARIVGPKSINLVIMAHGVQKLLTFTDGASRLTSGWWDYVINGNLRSAAFLTSALLRTDLLSDDGLIVYCSSIQAYTPRAGRGVYAAAKAGLEAMSKAVAAEIAPRRTVALRLGQLAHTMKGIEFTDEQRAELEKRSFLPWVDELDIAEFCEALYYQKSITGCVIDMDSGHGRNVW